jgi:biliverdin reductase
LDGIVLPWSAYCRDLVVRLWGQTLTMGDRIRVGLVGTGYAAKLRAEAFSADARSELVAIAGRDAERVREFAGRFGVATQDWRALVSRTDLDLVVVSTVNGEHGAIVRAALEADKHVVVEYPLALSYGEGQALAQLAEARGRLLHVEHIERLGGMHGALLANLPEIGAVYAVRYATIVPQRPAPRKWTYNFEQFGFPLVGALSRVQRLTHAIGPVASVTCQAKFWPEETESDYFHTCLCTAQLFFVNGAIGTITYGKGEALWYPARSMEVQGALGGLSFEGDRGVLTTPEGSRELEVAGKRGIFVKDTTMVLDYLLQGTPLYIQLEESLYALKVAEATQRAAETGQTIVI